jgi:hypothetical protein
VSQLYNSKSDGLLIMQEVRAVLDALASGVITPQMIVSMMAGTNAKPETQKPHHHYHHNDIDIQTNCLSAPIQGDESR